MKVSREHQRAALPLLLQRHRPDGDHRWCSAEHVQCGPDIAHHGVLGVCDRTLRRAGAGLKNLELQVRGIVLKRHIVRCLQTLDTNPNDILSAEDIIEFTKTSSAEEHPDRDIGKFLWTQGEGVDVDNDKYRGIVKKRRPGLNAHRSLGVIGVVYTLYIHRQDPSLVAATSTVLGAS
jgi:hypothetical protein